MEIELDVIAKDHLSYENFAIGSVGSEPRFIRVGCPHSPSMRNIICLNNNSKLPYIMRRGHHGENIIDRGKLYGKLYKSYLKAYYYYYRLGYLSK